MFISLIGNRGTFDSTLNIVSLILIFIFVLALAYLAARLSAKYQGNINSKSNIKAIESFRIGGNKLISIIKIGDSYYAIGVGKDEITLIDKLDAEKIDLSNYEKNISQNIDFKEIFSKIKKSDCDSQNSNESKDKDNKQ